DRAKHQRARSRGAAGRNIRPTHADDLALDPAVGHVRPAWIDRRLLAEPPDLVPDLPHVERRAVRRVPYPGEIVGLRPNWTRYGEPEGAEGSTDAGDPHDKVPLSLAVCPSDCITRKVLQLRAGSAPRFGPVSNAAPLAPPPGRQRAPRAQPLALPQRSTHPATDRLAAPRDRDSPRRAPRCRHVPRPPALRSVAAGPAPQPRSWMRPAGVPSTPPPPWSLRCGRAAPGAGRIPAVAAPPQRRSECWSRCRCRTVPRTRDSRRR